MSLKYAKSSCDPISISKKLDMVACTCHSGSPGNINRTAVQAGLGVNLNDILSQK
jgi:hypothetical protein